ncbi:hypothetical protein A2533_00415 [Candidatus Falkowbacteria bacterium RIFOXYD2_FULL_35_9]|uniref:Probable endonuclease 4 n=1 Tax=Candidatus Falkowbacteria bacterium RIFOXYC2_FULL_36_12 TaxID=1798002 RepID=A0A1F5T380_9BACT|nr:MAG: hypothetical protein A2300_01875 [Candidatus Falkowbacteria bacterium RIFOXYB2_FULL_35_7]OGF33047.1 MAG: hypothetical protein A2223_04100 [Candidatus Falkowbacteria bacterium RIFOXYA2_FULL_35_8]OGF33408.1 MAG: hypothetical protein A2478_01770 [Candidatus Falkowbacteria bacterium RIFOXYC2_FULL_36_12]OGF46542.1 MAG: hypothetical protein A2533_00415 [Candidatus Falkowbacteria bacterium RIFOXYD2_FULL_35_9]
MKLGAHVSIAGGIFKAPLNAKKLGCETFQIFSRSPRGGMPPEITDNIVEQFKNNMEQADIKNFYIHAPYFINLASDKPRIAKGSIEILRSELERGNKLGAVGVMFHMGSAKDFGSTKSLKMAIDAINEILENYDGKTLLLIENSAGAGEILGDKFDEIGFIIKKIKNKAKIGVCLDTCHMFASGYDMRDKKSLGKTLMEFEKHIGIKFLQVIHLNDSKTELGSNKDRHEVIGNGLIGQEGFKQILHNIKLKSVDGIIETPDLKNNSSTSLNVLKKLR